MSACGTYTAHQQHLKRGEVPCEACKAARRDYHNTRRAKARALAAEAEARWFDDVRDGDVAI